MPDALAGLAASAALAVSDIPFNGPISEVRVARINGEFVINPTFEQLEKADMDLMVGATYENIMMVEGEMKEVSEQDLLEAMKFAHEAIKVHCKAQMELMEEVGKTVKTRILSRRKMTKTCARLYTMLATKKHTPLQNQATRTNTKEEMLSMLFAKNSRLSSLKKNWKKKGPMIDRYYHDVEKEAMRRCILDEGKRLDGRATTEIRPIWCETSPLPGPSRLFYLYSW